MWTSADGCVQGAILEITSRMWRAGISGSAEPSLEIPLVAGAPTINEQTAGGKAVWPLDMSTGPRDVDLIPIVSNDCGRVVIENEDLIKECLQFTLKGAGASFLCGRNTLLGVELPLVLAEPAFTYANSGFRQTLGELLFETFDCSAGVCFIKQPVLATFACARTSGKVFDSGHTGSILSVVVDGFLPHDHNNFTAAGGCYLTRRLQEILKNAKLRPIWCDGTRPRYVTNSVWEWGIDEAAERIKITECSLIDEDPSAVITLPDGTKIEKAAFARQLPEGLISGINRVGYPGIREFINESSEGINQQNLSVVLTGGSTEFPGFADRTRDVLSECDVVQLAKARYSPYVGGSILSSLGSLSSFVATQEAWRECGVNAIARLSP